MDEIIMIDGQVAKENELTFEDLVNITMQAIGVIESEAEFIVSLELGLIPETGDVLTDAAPDPDMTEEIRQLLNA